MKTFKSIIIGIIVLSFVNVNSQSLTSKQLDKKNNKVMLFTVQEYSNLHLWFYNNVQDMVLSNDVEEQYSYIISKYTYKMSRLDDKDSLLNPEEIRTQMTDYIQKMNEDSKPILSQDQYRIHKRIMDGLQERIFEKLDLKYS
ncbi:hypothetical protein [Psychroserpens sp.]|uniref:hypothetical protein n=1 Tax=Psychroserpens sp. TaxID=2020870 RepID=UPI001B2C0530|nr:hypothetical protein [Psychroserpens sp.]MBO6607933.1 hypothetical protein [Psychroserpens sp.]MBO6630639.1 hypothetical protein [Psychroserpens sp.]MBO6654940.1 hypothetical protein [Psychroserpens sp.]MBO6682986.1 hypothetical protein [Psychroserpens sp.]MBO6751291.1 hypothetical protein [Psychroserpens sp.]